MRIIDMVNAPFPNAANYEKPAQNNTGFDMFLAEAGRRQTERTTERAPDNRPDNRANKERNRTENREARRESARPVQRAPETEEAANQTENAAAVDAQNAIDEATDTTEINEAAIIEEVAEILQVPAEVVIEWLAELEISAKDLTEPQMVAKMLQLALDAENASELLTHPDFPEKYKAVNEALAKLQAEAAPVVTKAATGETVTVNTEGLEALEAVVKDGEVVISEKVGENSPGNSGQQSSTQTSTQTSQPEQTQSAAPAAPAAEIPDATALTPDENIAHESQALTPTTAAPTTTNTPTVPPPTPQQPVTATNVIEQIMSQVKITSAGVNFTEMRMTLRPESLGDIVLRVVTQNGIVMAQFEAESQRVKEMLEANFNQLRDALTEQGITFSELSVSVRQDENERASEFERARQASRHRAESIEDISEQEEVSYHNGMIDMIA